MIVIIYIQNYYIKNIINNIIILKHMSCSEQRIYIVLNYPSQSQTKTLLTGIKQDLEDPTVYYITGFTEENSNSIKHKIKVGKDSNYTTFIYKGNLSGLSISDKGNWYIFNYPSSPNRTVNNTNLYGPAIFENSDNIRAVGNYTTVEDGNKAYGCMYEGRLNGKGKWSTIMPPKSIQTIVHSLMSDLAVGNYLVNGDQNSKAFIYNIKKDKYVEIIKPKSLSITAYGIWRNSDSRYSYTICGGYSEHVTTGAHIAYVVDYNVKFNEFTNWTSYRYNNSKDLITHFEGISATDEGYSLASDAVVEGKEIASIAYIRRKQNGKFSSKAKWEEIFVPNKEINSANSIAGTTLIGVASSNPSTVDGFVSIVI